MQLDLQERKMDIKSNLYLLVFPDINSIKIGKANDINKRISSLKRWWGQVDYQSSYFVASTEKRVFKIESILHFLLEPYKTIFNSGDGKEELYSPEALEIALQYLSIYTGSKNCSLVVKKGIPDRIKQPIGRLKQKKILNALKTNEQKLNDLHQIVYFLLKYFDRIKYQYYFDSMGNLYFKVLKEGYLKKVDYDSIQRLFYFYFPPCSFITLCLSFSGSNDFIQFKISPFDGEDDPTNENYTFLLFEKLMNLFKSLPQRSPLLSSDILKEVNQ
jgi:hypothetical protein